MYVLESLVSYAPLLALQLLPAILLPLLRLTAGSNGETKHHIRIARYARAGSSTTHRLHQYGINTAKAFIHPRHTPDTPPPLTLSPAIIPRVCGPASIRMPRIALYTSLRE
jgi:hypothetical protein